MELSGETWLMLGRTIGAGLALGLGGIGAAVGMGMAAGQANEGMMRQPAQQSALLRTMLLGQAVGSSPSIFALVIGLLILFVPINLEPAGGNVFAALVGAGLAIGLGGLGGGAGCGFPAGAACDGGARNPRRLSKVMQGMFAGQAVTQSPCIFATVVAFVLLFFKCEPGTDLAAMGLCLGAGLAVGASAFGPGVGSGQAAGGAVQGMGRWPASHTSTFRMMLIGQGTCQTPAIFGALVAFLMLFVLDEVQNDIVGFAKVFGAGIAVGFGGLGPGIGSGMAGSSACLAAAARPDKGGLIMRTMLTGQAVSQSTAIYALIIGLLLVYLF